MQEKKGKKAGEMGIKIRTRKKEEGEEEEVGIRECDWVCGKRHNYMHCLVRLRLSGVASRKKKGFWLRHGGFGRGPSHFMSRCSKRVHCLTPVWEAPPPLLCHLPPATASTFQYVHVMLFPPIKIKIYDIQEFFVTLLMGIWLLYCLCGSYVIYHIC